ncbi:MAG TPA: hypothetical protein P5268_09320 [Candidatus Marinimicrobia bacterium]|mgnify:CR=1 FL=1|nr:hypothetical protein [Candidatus Neomarinimicrobiota bacterium]HRU93213.1 hypothetical protein [Candidatus Neomarinimicrobiota bacterium]
MYPSIDDFKLLNENFISIPDNQIRDLLNALKMKDFEWHQDNKYFYNTNLNKAIKVSELHHFDACSIIEDWGNQDFIIRHSNLLFLTKFIFWGLPLLLILAIILLVIGKYLNAIILFLFTVIMYFLVEGARKFYHTEKKSGIKPSSISSILIIGWIINVVLLFISSGNSTYNFIFLILMFEWREP